MRKLIFFTLFYPVFSPAAICQSKPKLVVGIVVDQMRYDYLYAFQKHYSANGFKRLLNEGFVFHDAHYNYVPTYTGPGHTSIYTGTTPAYHGIVANDWFDRTQGIKIYCTTDTTVLPVGTPNSECSDSPHRNIATTVTDELRIASNKKARVIGVALKDRASVLPAGHNPNGAYWYDDSTGNWITSTWYMKELPAWVKQYNDRKRPMELINNGWRTLDSIDTYDAGWGDNNPYERFFAPETAPVFPHPLKAIAEKSARPLGIVKFTPAGCTITTEMAMAAITGESLGKDDITDFLCISYSSPDYVGHYYGTHSVEMEDTYARLDRELATLFQFLDKNVGKGNYTVFLTADHAAADNAALRIYEKNPAGYFNPDDFAGSLNNHLKKIFAFDTSYVQVYMNQQVYFNHDLISHKHIDLDKVLAAAQQFCMDYPGVSDVVTGKELLGSEWTATPRGLVKNGYMYSRCGDIMISLLPGWMEYDTLGTTHGTHYTYDTHVPLVWMGKNILKGSTAERVYITDIAPTLCIQLGIPYPSACTGKPLTRLTDK